MEGRQTAFEWTPGWAPAGVPLELEVTEPAAGSAELPLGVWREDSWVPHEPDRRDPFFDWRTVFKSGDVVRLQDGRIGVVEGCGTQARIRRRPSTRCTFALSGIPGSSTRGLFGAAIARRRRTTRVGPRALGLLD